MKNWELWSLLISTFFLGLGARGVWPDPMAQLTVGLTVGLLWGLYISRRLNAWKDRRLEQLSADSEKYFTAWQQLLHYLQFGKMPE